MLLLWYYHRLMGGVKSHHFAALPAKGAYF